MRKRAAHGFTGRSNSTGWVRVALTLLLAATLAACSSTPQRPVYLEPQVLRAAPTRVGVMLSIAPKADTYLPGASCLLCYATASALTTSLTQHAGTLTTAELVSVREDLLTSIRATGAEPVVIDEKIDVAKLRDASRRDPTSPRRTSPHCARACRWTTCS